MARCPGSPLQADLNGRCFAPPGEKPTEKNLDAIRNTWELVEPYLQEVKKKADSPAEKKLVENIINAYKNGSVGAYFLIASV